MTAALESQRQIAVYGFVLLGFLGAAVQLASAALLSLASRLESRRDCEAFVQVEWTHIALLLATFLALAVLVHLVFGWLVSKGWRGTPKNITVARLGSIGLMAGAIAALPDEMRGSSGAMQSCIPAIMIPLTFLALGIGGYFWTPLRNRIRGRLMGPGYTFAHPWLYCSGLELGC